MSKLCKAVAIVAILGTGAASAGDVTPGFGASLRVGYGTPMGAIGDSSGDLGDVFSGQIPVQLDLGYRVTPELSIAIFGQYAATFLASLSACTAPGVSCSARDVRTGVEVFWHVLPGHKFEPWVATGLGFEWSRLSAEGPGVKADVTLSGFEFFDLQAGADFPVTPAFACGPFVQLTVAQYSTATSSSGSGTSQTTDIQNTRAHEWLQLGVRGSFGL